MELESRIARLESDVDIIKQDIREMRSELRGEIKDLRIEMRSEYRFVRALMMFLAFLLLAGMMAKGFEWI